MIFDMPVVTFVTFLSWPFTWIILSVIVYRVMKKQDDLIDDAEFTTVVKGGDRA